MSLPGNRMRKEYGVAGSRRPSFLKRQKEQKRLARATEKRETRLARKRAQAEQPEPTDQVVPAEPVDSAQGADSEATKPMDDSPEIN